ncbi:MAG: NDMA-dependent alcohol dehydrogenase [Streptosporangiaceae bacterium]
MKTRAAVLREPGRWWEVEELELDEPKAGEVLVRFMACGLCHSDDHIRSGDAPARLPMVGGHEGAGVVEAVGPGVTRVNQGDHVVCSFIPVCGTCRYCSTGRQNLCDAGLNAGVGCLPDGTFRFHSTDGEDLGGMCVLGTFSERAVLSETSCVAIEQDIPFELAALVSCGVPTGWGSAVYVAGVRPGDTVVVFGIGGVGINAVQGARYAGAKNVVAVDPVEFKLETAQALGATHVSSDPVKARELVVDLTRGQLADHAICTVGVMSTEVVQQAVDIVGKGSQVTITGVGDYEVRVHGGVFPGWQKRVLGAMFGGANPLYDIPRLLGLYRSGDLKLAELITQRYTLDQVNGGFRDMLDGKNVRGVMIHEHD